MNSYKIRTNLLVSALAAVITVAIQITMFQTTYITVPLTGEQIRAMSSMTNEEKIQYRRKNTEALTGLENAKGYFSSSQALFSLMKREALPIFFAVFISLFAVNL